ncbi:MAG: hypothetical protein HY525_15830 [Betaproteobacteria bacterium]|nr:hypothetical protein [Betaproteobacteria bacterium]
MRNIPRVAAGDAIAFDVVGQEVRVRKAQPADLAFARSLALRAEQCQFTPV